MDDFYQPSQVPFQPQELAPRVSNWPKVLGIIGIVMGAGGFLNSGFALLMGDGIYKMFSFPPELVEKHSLALKTLPALGSALGLWLLMASIFLLLRKRIARPFILLWAVLKIGFACWQAPLQLAFQKDMAPFQTKMIAASQPKGDPHAKEVAEFTGKMMESVAMATVIASVGWLCVLPIFYFIWFARGKIRADIASWPSGAVGPA